jgi:hypothetical protein
MLKFLLRLIKHISILLFVLLPLEVFGWIVVLPVCFLSRKSSLPRVFRWFDNADIYPEFNRNPITYLKDVIPKGVLYRYYWLALRNPLNYFGYKILGWKSDRDIVASIIGDSANKRPGYDYIEVNDKGSHYEYYYIHKWNSTHCFRFRMGWKLQDTKVGDWVQWVLVIQPYKSYSGI